VGVFRGSWENFSHVASRCQLRCIWRLHEHRSWSLGISRMLTAHQPPESRVLALSLGLLPGTVQMATATGRSTGCLGTLDCRRLHQPPGSRQAFAECLGILAVVLRCAWRLPREQRVLEDL
jgi:hypothetical protein